MSLVTYVGLLLSLIVAFAYVVCAFRGRSSPELGKAINTFICTASLVGALRLVVGAIILGFDLARAEGASPVHSSPWEFSGEDVPVLVIGGIALGWVSLGQLCTTFREALKAQDGKP